MFRLSHPERSAGKIADGDRFLELLQEPSAKSAVISVDANPDRAVFDGGYRPHLSRKAVLVVGLAALREMPGLDIGPHELVIDIDLLRTDRLGQISQSDGNSVSAVREVHLKDEIVFVPNTVAGEIVVLLVDDKFLRDELCAGAVPCRILGRTLDVKASLPGALPPVSFLGCKKT